MKQKPSKHAATPPSILSGHLAGALMVLIIGFAVLINLMTYALYQDQRAANDKLGQQLYNERLKREYFEWRESTSTGHKTAKDAFPRWDELEAAGTQSR